MQCCRRDNKRNTKYNWDSQSGNRDRQYQKKNYEPIIISQAAVVGGIVSHLFLWQNFGSKIEEKRVVRYGFGYDKSNIPWLLRDNIPWLRRFLILLVASSITILIADIRQHAMITNLNSSSSYIQRWKKKDGDNRLLLAAPPIQLHVTYVVGSSSGRHRYKRETPPYGTHWVGCVIPLLCCAILWYKTRLNGSRGVGAVFLNLRMLSKKRN